MIFTQPKRIDRQSGFTLMEIVVATLIFATTLTLMLSLFVYTLRVNRRVESLRQVSQGTRNFMEFFIKEVRNGQIDYHSVEPACSAAKYSGSQNQAIAIINSTGEKDCFYLSGTNFFIIRKGVTEQLNPSNFTIDQNSFRFIISPTIDPAPPTPPYPSIQPSVTISAKFIVRLGPGDPPAEIPYQTTISTDNYAIPHN